METNKESSDDKSTKGLQSRKTALEILIRVHQSGAYSNIALSQAFEKSQLSKRDKAFVTLLVQGVTRNLSFLDDIIQQYSARPLNKLPAVLLNTLRIGIFQLEFLQDTPPSAILNTCTQLAKTCGHKGMASYTTAVLRGYLRAKEASDQSTSEPKEGRSQSSLPTFVATDDLKNLSTKSLSTKYSLPLWLVERWMRNLGTDETIALLEYSRSEPRIVLRTNELGISTEGLKTILENAGVNLEVSQLVPCCLVMTGKSRGHGSPSNLPGYDEGLFSIQDDTAAFVSTVLGAKAGETILDLCAAPGGKTLFLAELMESKGRIIAVDTRANRLELLKKNRNRLGLTNIEVMEADGTKFELPQLVDRILIDAPCSGTGVLNRKADLRHKRKEEDIAVLADLQLDLLQNAAKLLKSGGVLVYSTCSVEPEENERVLERFLTSHPQFKVSDLTSFFPASLVEEHQLAEKLKEGSIQILPSMAGLSGFFIARLVKD